MRRARAACAILCLWGAAAGAQGTPHFQPEGSTTLAPHERLSGYAGFRFGARPAQARRTCARAGFQVTEVPESTSADGRVQEASLRCAGRSSLMEQPALVQLEFCGGRLCQVEIALDPWPHLDDKVHYRAWARVHRALLSRLRAEHGPELTSSVQASLACRQRLEEEDDASCFQRESVARHFWRLGDSELVLSLEPSHDPLHVAPRVLVRVMAPARRLELSRTSD